MKIKLSALIPLLLILGCDISMNRYDPLVGSENMFRLDSIVFRADDNSAVLIEDMTGRIGENSLLLIHPPSWNGSDQSLRARCRASHNGQIFDFVLDRTWNTGDRFILDRKLFDSTWEGDSLLATTYDVTTETRLISTLSLSSAEYSPTPDFILRLDFNDYVSSSLLPYSPSDLINGLEGSNFIPPTASDFTPPLSQPDHSYLFNLRAAAEGVLTLYLSEASTADSLHRTPNAESNRVTLVYDATPPVIENPELIVTGLDRSIASYTQVSFTLKFTPSRDELTAREDLLYTIHFSHNPTDLEGSPSDLFANADQLDDRTTGETGTLTRSFDQLPYSLKQLLIQGHPVYFGLTVEDRGGNASLYDYGSQIYQGVTYP